MPNRISRADQARPARWRRGGCRLPRPGDLLFLSMLVRHRERVIHQIVDAILAEREAAADRANGRALQ
jgi:hypothetical protein